MFLNDLTIQTDTTSLEDKKYCLLYLEFISVTGIVEIHKIYVHKKGEKPTN